jgi:hypothetical protein
MNKAQFISKFAVTNKDQILNIVVDYMNVHDDELNEDEDSMKVAGEIIEKFFSNLIKEADKKKVK